MTTTGNPGGATAAPALRLGRLGMLPALALSFSLSFALALAVALPSPAAAQSLLEQCWPAAALAARPDERSPRRLAAGGNGRGAHLQAPRLALAPFAPVSEGLHGSIRRVALPPGRKLMALTFDLCEQPGEVAGYDGSIVDYLRANNVRATFFAGGKWLLTHPERAEQLMADPRFEIASHGFAHRNVRGLAGRALVDEIRGPQAAYEATRARLAARQCVTGPALAAVPPRIRLFRFPYGACHPEALAATAANGLLAVQWDVSTGDPWPGQSAEAIVATVLRQARPGSIVLMHANGRGYNTAAALPRLIPRLKAQGYELVTVSELLAAGRPEISPTCYDARPGGTDKYDRLFTSSTEVRRGH